MEFKGIQAQYQALAPGIRRRVEQVMRRGDFIGGEEVAQLERRLEAYVGVEHCIGCGSGTDALSLILEALEIGENDAVFVPAFTFFATAEAVSAAGAQPVFVDVEPRTFNLSANGLLCAIKEHRGKTPRAVVAADLFGLPCDYPLLEAICARHGLVLIEDAAQGFGGHVHAGEKLRRAGSFGAAAATSFFPAKPLGCYGDGGAVFTRDQKLAERIRIGQNHGRKGRDYRHFTVGRNSRLDTLQAAILLEKLDAFPAELARVNRAARLYDRLIGAPEAVPRIPEGFYSSRAQYTLTLPAPHIRDALRRNLENQEIPCAVYYPEPLHRQPVYQTGQSLPVAEMLSGRVLSLPLHPYLADEDIQKTAHVVRQALEGGV